MKKMIVGLVLVCFASFAMVSCGTSGGGGGTTTENTLLGMITSYTKVWIMTNATVNFSNHVTPITGDGVTGATVTVSNETQGTSTALTASTSGLYVKAGYSAAAGDNLSLTITAGDDTLTGDATEVPNPTYTSLAPAVGLFPLTVSWEVTYQAVTTYEPTHTHISVVNQSDPTVGFQEVVPISQTSIQITSAEVTAGTYQITLQGFNSMDLTGAKSGSVVYVGGGAGTGTVIVF